MKIVDITEQNYPQVNRIYEEGIATKIATFQDKGYPWTVWDEGHHTHSRLAAIDNDGHMLGWASLAPVSGRCCYQGVAEVSIYIGADSRGKGIGMLLLNKLIEESEKHGIWSLYSAVFPQNEGSIALHKKCGFRYIGYREKIGKLHGEWVDNVLLERRSKTVGIE